jgi:hypothetical protein
VPPNNDDKSNNDDDGDDDNDDKNDDETNRCSSNEIESYRDRTAKNSLSTLTGKDPHPRKP